MYETNTILTLKDQRPNDPETDEVFPYNEVRVIGPSPVTHAGIGEWSGQGAAGVIIEPTSNFGSNLDEPFEKLVALYDVKTLPPAQEIAVGPSVIPVTKPGPTPEEVFAQKAPGVKPEPGQKRGRTRMSPLDAPAPAANEGPLGPAPPAEPVEPVSTSPLDAPKPRRRRVAK